MKRATTAALVLGLALGVACGSAKVLPEPTTILVKVHLIASQNIDQLFVSGTVNGFDEFPRTYLPDDAGTPFNGPQSFRVLLDDSEDGKAVEVDVFGLTQGNPVAAGLATVTVRKQQEVEADIDLSPNKDGGGGGNGGGGGGASATGGGTGMGGGTGTGGGAMTICACDAGCCQPGSSSCSAPKQITLMRLQSQTDPSGSFVATDCGAPLMQCGEICDPLRGVCLNGRCACGQNQCKAGERCQITGTGGNTSFACKCDEFSACEGCCSPNGTNCVPTMNQDAGVCGNSGNECKACTGGTVNAGCNSGGVCTGISVCGGGGDKCASGVDCLDVQFPTCAASVGSRCVACDPIRSNKCDRLAGVTSDGCACGGGSQCAPGNYCDNAGTCQPLF